MNILYIDTQSFAAHANYNKIQINALLNLNCSITFCFKKGYKSTLGLSNNEEIIELPRWLDVRRSNGIFNRLITFLKYWYILFRFHSNFSKFDYILFSYFDEIPLYFTLFPRNTLLINHVNVAGISRNKIKRFFYKKISNRYQQIIMDEFSNIYLKSIGISNAKVVHHGLVEPYKKINDEFIEDKIIFCPSFRSSDMTIINQLIANDKFLALLDKYKFKFIIKGNYSDTLCDSITVIDKFLSEEEYKALFLKSKIIFLPYPRSFNYRTSGVLLEGIANNKIMLVSNIQSLTYYQKFYDGIIPFADIDDLISKIDSLFISQHIHNHCVVDRDILSPDYSFLCN